MNERISRFTEHIDHDSIRLTRSDNTEFVYEFEREWCKDQWRWCARVFIHPNEMRVRAGGLTLDELKHVRENAHLIYGHREYTFKGVL